MKAEKKSVPPVKVALDKICGSWKAVILYELQSQTLRFGELRKRVSGITQSVLTRQLNQLEKDGFIKREVYYQIPMKVEYSLTSYGKETKPVLEALNGWGADHHLHYRENEGSYER